MADNNKKRSNLEDEMNRFEQEIAGNLPPPPKMPKMPGMMAPPSFMGRPPMPPPFMNQKNGGRPPSQLAFPGPPPQMPPNMFGPPMGGLPPPSMQHGLPVPPPMMIPPPMPMPMPPMGMPQMQGGSKKVAPPMVPPAFIPPPIAVPSSSSSGASNITNSVDGGLVAGQLPEKKKKEKKKTVVRVAGSNVWEDESLLDWDPNDFRIFVGDLGNEVSDDALLRAFSRYPSLNKARVVRDKRTKKTKGYGFVSFKDPQDYLKAMREMNGKYVGNRPIKLRKSTWKDRNIMTAKKKEKEKKKLGLR